MSTTIDNRVLEMRFDNKQFESGVATSMSTLEKLKQKLNLSGAAKGLESINTAAKNVRFDGMISGIDTVTSKFSYMQMTIQHQLNNIVDSCVTAGKRMVSALTIDPVKSGFQEYETQINAVQTILANTSSKGTTLDQVNQALDELNKYADLTIYNFTEMTRNIGTFTAAGVDLETSVSAIQGIANVAAVSGSTSQQASTAMYQLSQALAAGTVKLMDWNSVVNAGMGGEVFQNALKDTSELLGTGAEAAIKANGSFRESLSTGWLTAEVLTETLKKFTTSGANEYVAKYTGLSQEAVESALEEAKARHGEAKAIDEAAKALAKKSGKNEDEIKSVLQMARTAEDAATKVKTFTQLIDTLKESLQSGWTQTWEILIGDFEEAKELFTGISDTLSDFINKSAESRNAVLEGAMTSGWDKLILKINEAGIETEDFEQKVIDLGRSRGLNMDRLIKDYGSLEEAIQAGAVSTDILKKALDSLGGSIDGLNIDGIFQFGDGLDEASDDVKKIQEALVDAGFELEKFGVDGKFGQETQEAVKAFQEAHGLVADGIVGPETLKALDEASGKTGKLTDEIYSLVDGVTVLGARQLIIESFKNAWKALSKIFGTVKTAWQQIFPPATTEEKIQALHNIIEAVHDFSEKLIISDDTAAKLERTFRGLFAVIDVVRLVVGGGLGAAFKILSKVLGSIDIDILSVTACIGDALVGFRDWIYEGNLVAKSINALIDKLPVLIAKFKAWFDVFEDTPAVQKFVDAINSIKEAFVKLTTGEISVEELATSLGTGLANALKALPGIAIQIGKDFIAGFQNGISDSVTGVIDKIVSFCINFVSAFADALGVESPSWKAYDIVVDFFQGAINGIKAMAEMLFSSLGTVGEGIVKVFESFWTFVSKFILDEGGNIKWDNIFSTVFAVAAALFGKKVLGIFENLTDPLGGISDVLENFAEGLPKLMKNMGKALGGLKSMFKGIGFEYRTEGIKNLATAILMLVGAVAIITMLDPDRLWEAVGVIGVLVAIIAALAIATSFLSSGSFDVDLKKGTASLQGLKQSLASIAAAILMVAISVKMLGGMKPEEIKQGLIGVASIAGGLLAFAAAMSFLTQGKFGSNADKVGKMMSKLAFAMLLMIAVVKLSNTITEDEAKKGALFALAFGVFVMAITKVAKSAGNNVGKVGGMILKITIAMALMVGVVKLVSLLSPEAMVKGALFATGFAAFVWALVKVTKIGKRQQLAKVTGMLLSVSVAMLAMAAVCRITGSMDTWSLVKGLAAVGVFSLIIKSLINTVKGNGSDVAKLSGTLIAFSIAIGLLAGVAFLLGQMDIAELAKGLIAIGILSACIYAITKASNGANNVGGSFIGIAIAIAVIAAAVAALSMLDPTSLIAPTIALGILMGMFALIAKSSKDMTGSIGPLIVMTVAIAVMAGALAALSLLKPESLIAPTIALAVLMGMFTLMLRSLKTSDMKLAPLIAMTAVIAVFAGILYLLRDLKWQSALAAVGGIVILMIALVAAMKVLSGGPGMDLKSIIGIAVLTVVIAVLGYVISQLKDIDPASAIGGAVGIVILLAGLVGVLYLCAGLSSIAGKAIVGALVLGAFMIILAGVIWVIAKIAKDIIADMPEMARNLSLFMMNLQPFLLGSQMIPDGLLGKLASLAAGMALLGIGSFILAITNLLTNLLGQSMPQLASELSNFMMNLQPFLIGSQMIPDGLLGKLASLSAGMIVLGIGQFVSAVVNLLMNLLGTSMPQLGAELSGFMINLQPFLLGSQLIPDGIAGKLTALSAGMITLGIGQFVSAVINLLMNLLGTNMPQLATELSGFMTNLQPFLIGSLLIPEGIAGKLTALSAGMIALGIGQCITALTNLITNLLGTNMPQLASELSGFMTNLAPFLIGSLLIPEGIAGKLTGLSAGMVALGIGQCITALTNLITNILGQNMPQLASELSGFMTNLMPFLLGIMMVPDNIAIKATALSAAMVALGIGQAITAITNLIGTILGNDLPTLGSDLGGFLTNAMPFITGISSVPDDIVTKVGLLTEAIGDLTTENFWKNIKEFFSGGDNASLANLGTELSTLGTGLATFSTSAASFSVSSETTTAVTDFIETMGEIDSSATTNLGNLSGGITDLGTAIAGFAATTGEMNTAGISTAISTAYSMKYFIDAIKDLDISGVANFTGIGTGGLGADGPVSDIAEAIADFSEKLTGIDISAVSIGVSAALRLKTLISSLTDLDTSGIENFKVDSIGTAIKDYLDEVTGMDISAVNVSVSAAKRLRDFIPTLSGLDMNGVSTFKPSTLGSSLRAYAMAISGVDFSSIAISIASATRIKNFISSLSGLDTSGTASFVSAINELGTVSIEEIVKSFSGASSEMLSAGSNLIESVTKGMSSKQVTLLSTVKKLVEAAEKAITSKATAFLTAGGMLMMKLASGLQSKNSSISSAASSAVSRAVTSIRSHYNSFSSAGRYLGDGLVAGINSKKQAAYDAGYALGKKAVEGEKAGQQSNSPSKLTIKAGKWLGEGLVIGIKKMGNSVYKAGYNIGDTAASSMSDSISKVSDLINTGMDTEPTIRPVMDLSDIRAGASAIDGMFGNSLSLGATANIGAISSMMNERNQNGVNGDVVSAINKLRKELGNVGNTSYNINGITYDDGSNITEAVKSLIRAARLERRI